jgi:lipopolysaccharide export system protein LptA
MNRVNAKFFSKNGIVYDVSAGETRFDSETKNMQFRGDVFVQSSNGYHFNTDQLKYSTEAESLLSDTEVQFNGFSKKESDALKMRGDRMAIQLETGVAQIIGNVVSEKFEANKQNLSFHSENVVLSNDGSEARFQKDVEIKYEDMILRGPEAIVKYDTKSKGAKSLDIIDGVKVEALDKNAVSERLHLDIDKENLILEGRPRLLQKGDELLGTAIIFKNRGKSLEVKGAKAHLNSGSSGTVLDE